MRNDVKLHSTPTLTLGECVVISLLQNRKASLNMVSRGPLHCAKTDAIRANLFALACRGTAIATFFLLVHAERVPATLMGLLVVLVPRRSSVGRCCSSRATCRQDPARNPGGNQPFRWTCTGSALGEPLRGLQRCSAHCEWRWVLVSLRCWGILEGGPSGQESELTLPNARRKRG